MDFLGVGTITSRSVIAFSIFNKRFSGFYIDSCKIWLVLLRSSRVEGCPGGLPLIFTPCGDYYKSSASPAKSELRMRPDHGSTIYCCVSLRVPSEFTHDRWSPFSVYCFWFLVWFKSDSSSVRFIRSFFFFKPGWYFFLSSFGGNALKRLATIPESLANLFLEKFDRELSISLFIDGSIIITECVIIYYSVYGGTKNGSVLTVFAARFYASPSVCTSLAGWLASQSLCVSCCAANSTRLTELSRITSLLLLAG